MADDVKNKDEAAETKDEGTKDTPPPPHHEETSTETTHKVTIAGKAVEYTATAGRVILTEEEGKKYWLIYEDYFAERSKIMDERMKMYKMIAEKYGSMTNEDADMIADSFFDIESKLSELEKDTFNKVKDELSSLRGIQFLQIQRQIDTIVKLQMSAQFPLLK